MRVAERRWRRKNGRGKKGGQGDGGGEGGGGGEKMAEDVLEHNTED